MLVGRFLPMLFVLGLAGSLAAAEAGAGHRRHAADAHAAVRRRCSPASSSIVVALTYFPALALGPLAEGLHAMTATTAPRRPVSAGTELPRRVGGGLLDPRMLLTQLPAAVRQARPADDGAQPGDVRRRGRRRADHRARRRRTLSVFAWLIVVLAVGHRGVRQPGRGGGRGPRQGPGRRAAPRPGRRPPPGG